MEFISSYVSSLIASAIVYPIDVIKTQYQVSNINKGLQTNSYQLTKKLYIDNGMNGFFRGLTPNLLTYPIFWATFFQTKKLDYKPTGYEYVDKCYMAFLSSGVASTIANPLFVFKTRMQTNNLNNNINANYIVLVKSMYNNEGLSSFMKGLGPTLANNSKLVIQFPLYDYLKTKNDSVFLSSLISKTLASTIFYPFDLIRINQRESVSKLSFIDATKKVYYGTIKNSKPTFLNFYKGVVLYNFVTAPNFIIMMLLIEHVFYTNK